MSYFPSAIISTANSSNIPAALSTASGNNPTAADLLEDRARSNPLDNLDLSTYSLKLFMADPSTVQGSIEDFDGSDNIKIVLAQSGVTDIAFKDLSYDVLLALNQTTYTTTYTKFNMTLVEPLGCTLLDRIAEKAIEYNIDNFLKCPYWLEINFKGRDKLTGSPVNFAEGNDGQQLKKIIPIRILKVGISIKSSGSEYDIEAVRYADAALDDTVSVTHEAISVSGSTVREMFQNMQEVVNQRARDRRDRQSDHTNQENTADQYEFVLDDTFALGEDRVVRSRSILDHVHDNMPFDRADYNSTTISIPAGYDITRAIDMIMSVTDYMSLGVKPNNQPNQNENVNEQIVRRMFMIDTEVDIRGYDTGRGEYVRTFRYIVKKTTITDPLANPGEARNPRSDLGLNTSQDKAGILVKNYEYLFNGNKDVINFDCNINFAWYIPIPRRYGQGISEAHQSGPARTTLNNTETLVNAARIKNKPDVKTTLFNASAASGQTEIIATRPTGPLARLPITFASAPFENDLSGVIEGPNDVSRSFVSNLFRSGLSSQSGDLLKINLDVRGDPDWLNIEIDKQPYIRFSMGIPTEPGDNGLIQKDRNSMITGYYRVLKIKNTFTDGKFVQSLEAIRDPNITED